MQVVTSVSRGGLYNGVSGLEEAGSLGVLHHPQADPVLDAPAGIEELTLGHCKHRRPQKELLDETKWCIQPRSAYNTLAGRRVWGHDSRNSHLSPYTLEILLMRTSGVSPIMCRMFGRMFGRMVGAAVLGGESGDNAKKIRSTV